MMTLPDGSASTSGDELAARHAAYRASANDLLRKARTRRTKSLAARRDAIGRALAAYASLPVRPATFVLRPRFIALPVPRKSAPTAGGDLYLESDTLATRRRTERLSRPPATQLIAERSRALPTVLSMLYVAQAEADELGRFKNRRAVAQLSAAGPSWALLSGRYEPRLRARRERMRRDLSHLGEVGLVELAPTGQGRFERFQLNQEDNPDRRYVAPRTEQALPLPTELITNGWHLVLEPDELALYLAVMHLCASVPKRAGEPGWPLTRRVRFTVYGISSEAYNAVHELQEFGLLNITDTMPNRRRGKVRPPTQAQIDDAADEERSLEPVPYFLELIPGALQRPAMDVVTAQLNTFELPPRVRNAEADLETSRDAAALESFHATDDGPAAPASTVAPA